MLRHNTRDDQTSNRAQERARKKLMQHREQSQAAQEKIADAVNNLRRYVTHAVIKLDDETLAAFAGISEQAPQS